MTVLRWLAVTHTAAIFGQPVLAGLVLSGSYAALRLHAVGADVVFYLGVAQLLAAIAVWVRRGTRWPTAVAALVVAGETAQYVAGSAGALDLHLPLGVALVATSVLLVAVVWRHEVPVVRAAR